MGIGNYFECKNCHHEYRTKLGSGMLYPKVYQRLLGAIMDGDYGETLQEVAKQHQYTAVNAEYVLYICSDCRHWEISQDTTLYAPNNLEEIRTSQFGIKTVEEWGYVPYAYDWMLKESYHVIKRCYHSCPKCGRRMHKASAKEELNLPCPKCGTDNIAIDEYFWD